MKRMLALVLCFALVLSGCGARNALGFSNIVKFEDMEYTRPDMIAVRDAAENAMDSWETARNSEEVMDAVWEFFAQYEAFGTAYDLAYVHYHTWQNDIYWQAEYEFCAENAPTLDLYLESIYCALAQSPYREELEAEYFGEGWFESYENSVYDETLAIMMAEEESLIDRYYDMTAEAADMEEAEFYDTCALPLAQLLGELVSHRQEIAGYTGYDSYTDFAWDFYYYRDYTPAQAQEYLDELRVLVPLYEALCNGDRFAVAGEPCSEDAVFQYVQSAAKEMGGEIWEAFRLLDQGELADIGVSKHKSGLSFELYFSQYAQPYILIDGTGTREDCLVFAHEFGHFATDYAAAGSMAGIDVMEVFSQAMELLSLRYAEGGEDLSQMKLADALCTLMEQAAYAAFEQALYALPEDRLTGENILALYREICSAYGFAATADWDPRDLVTVPHFYSNPLYVISYVVSGDAALQLYDLEEQTPGTGRDLFQACLDTEESYFLAFLEEAGLESPFDRVDAVKKLMETQLG